MRGEYVLTDFPLDDAWIHRVYARSFAFLKGFAYNDLQESGSTSPFWAIATFWAEYFNFFSIQITVLLVKLFSIVLGLLCILEFSKITSILFHNTSLIRIATILFSMNPIIYYNIFSGMEVILVFYLWIVFVRAYMEKSYFVSSVALGLLTITRPESIVLLPFYFLNLLLPKEKNKTLTLKYGIVTVIPIILWALFNLHVNGKIFPNTFYAKSRSFLFSTNELILYLDFLKIHFPGSILYLFFGVCASLFLTIYYRTAKLLKFFVLLFIASLVFSIGIFGTRPMNPEGYYWVRWQDPATLALSVFACLGNAYLFFLSLLLVKAYLHFPQKKNHKANKFNYPLISFLLLFLFISCFSIFTMYKQMIEKRERLYTDSRAIHMINVNPGIWIFENTNPEDKIAVNDAGAIKYFSNRWTLDLLGLNYKEIVIDKKSQELLIQNNNIKYLVVFNSWFNADLFKNFTPIKSFEITPKEYTICNCPGQTKKTIYIRN